MRVITLNQTKFKLHIIQILHYSSVIILRLIKNNKNEILTIKESNCHCENENKNNENKINVNKRNLTLHFFMF